MSNFLDNNGLLYFWQSIKSKFLRGNAGGVFYGTCSTAAGTVAKVVDCADFTADNLKAGTIIIVSFSATNSGAVASLTMNVNGTGAKPIKYINNGTLGNLSSAGYLKANTEYPFYYDGANWVCWFNVNTTLTINNASESDIKGGTEELKPLTPNLEHMAVFYGLAKASGDSTQSQSSNTVGTYTDEAKTSIKSMLGVQDGMVVNATLVSGTQYTIDSTYDDIKTALSVGKTVVVMSQGIPQPYVGNVQIDNTWYLAFGISTTFNRRAVLTGFLIPETYQNIAIWMEEFADIPDVQIDGTSIVTNGVANIPIASANKVGVVKINAEKGIVINGNQELLINYSNDIQIKNGTENYQPIVPSKQHVSTFYGLTKAAGVDMASSSNTVGTYTESAKSAISDMLNGAVQVSGTDPTIVAKSGIRYVCGEVLTLDITVPSTGIIDVVFTSGSSPTVLTITPPTGMTMKWANNFDPAILEANATYEINIMDGYLGVIGKWT